MSLSRINDYKFIKEKYLNTSFYSTLCNQITTSLRGHISINKEIIYVNKGTWGFIFKVKLKNNKLIKIKIQIIPNPSFSSFKHLEDPRNIDVEKFIFHKCNDLILKKVTCNLPLFYNDIICKEYEYHSIMFITELSDNIFPEWITKNHSNLEWESFIFQMLSTFYVLKNHLKFFHNDMNVNNILYNIDKNNGYYNYNINNTDYYLPTTGNIFIIWDYANGNSLLLNNNNDIQDHLNNNDDFIKFNDTFLLMKMNNIYNSMSFDNLKEILKNNVEKYNIYFNKELKKINIKFNNVKNINKRKRKIKRSMHKSLCYFAIENDLYDLIMNDNIKDYKYNILPSKKILKLINNIFVNDKKLKIDKIIDKYFKKFKKKPNEKLILEKFIQ
jgi:hypothetical protein